MKIAVYTCIIGGYDPLYPVAPQTVPCDFYCFTDNPTLNQSGFPHRIVEFDPVPLTSLLPSPAHYSMVRTVLYRSRPDLLPFLSDYDIIVYIDANIEIKDPTLIESLIASRKLEDKILVTRHPERNNIVDEVGLSLITPKYSNTNFDSQLARYRVDIDTKNSGLYWNGLMIFFDPWNPSMKEFYLEYTRELVSNFINPNREFHPQGQVSLPWVFYRTKIKFYVSPQIYCSSRIKVSRHLRNI